MSSIQSKLTRVRKPRVHITYDVETGGAEVVKELPFVVGVLGDFSGNNPGAELPAMRDRKFVQIDRDNFNNVMAKITPGVSLRVKNTLDPESDSELAVNLQMKSMEDFEPAKIVDQVEPLRKLRETRDKLQELMNKVDRSDELDSLLEQVLTDSSSRDKMAQDLKLDEDEGDSK